MRVLATAAALGLWCAMSLCCSRPFCGMLAEGPELTAGRSGSDRIPIPLAVSEPAVRGPRRGIAGSGRLPVRLWKIAPPDGSWYN